MRYTCNCHKTNTHTNVFDHIWVFVYFVTSIGEPPIITKVDTDDAKRKYQPDEKVSFYCEATGVKLKYTWLQDEKELREHQRTLSIRKATQDTGGTYQCCVSNPFGEVKSESIKITVGE